MKEMYELKKPKEKLFCEQCGKLVRYKTTKKKENYNVKNYPIEVERTVAICEECGAELLEPYYENENLKAAYRKYAELNNLVLPEEIKEIRSKYNVSQTLFALILGLGEATIQRYEMGSLPTKVNSDLIKRVSEPVEFYKILKSNKDNIPDIEYKRILGNIQRILKEFENKLEIQELEKILYIKHPEIDIEKMKGLIAGLFYYSKKYYHKDFLYKTVFFKLLWLVEKESKKVLGRQIANLKFIHYNYGPIPKGAKNEEGVLLDYLIKTNLIKMNIDFSKKFLQETYKIGLVDQAPLRNLTNEERKIVEKIVKNYGGLSARKLVEVSHNDVAYKSSNYDEEIVI